MSDGKILGRQQLRASAEQWRRAGEPNKGDYSVTLAQHEQQIAQYLSKPCGT